MAAVAVKCGAEGGIAGTIGDFFIDGPLDGLSVVFVSFYVIKTIAIGCGTVIQSPQEGDDMTTGDGSVRAKGGLGHAVCDAIRKQGNCYQVTYRCPGESSPRTESFHSEEEAVIRDAQIKLAKKNGVFVPPERIAKGKTRTSDAHQNITLKAFLEDYVELYGLKMWGNSYYTTCIGLINNYINPYIGEHFIATITTRDIDVYYTDLLDKPAVLKQGHLDTGAKITPHTIGRIHRLLKSAFSKAVVWEYAKTNPTLGATLPKCTSKERSVWSDEEALHALRVCENPTLLLCMYLALGCSMRLGEILGLQWANVHIKEGSGNSYIKVDRELRRCSNASIEALERVNRSTILVKFPVRMPKKANTTLVLKAPKTESRNRTIYLPDVVVQILLKTKETQDYYKLCMEDQYSDYDLVVAQLNGYPYEVRTIDSYFYKLIRKHDLRPVVFHSLRHSSTSLKLKLSQGNIKAVQGDTGHAEARMVTDTYAHGFDADRKQIAKMMDSEIFSKLDDPKLETEAETPAVSLDLLKQWLRANPEQAADLLNEIV